MNLASYVATDEQLESLAQNCRDWVDAMLAETEQSFRPRRRTSRGGRMIDRSILDDPERPFDFFNDYQNTRWWLEGMKEREPEKATAAIRRLEERFAEYQVWRLEQNK
jgi:hypothetical protein